MKTARKYKKLIQSYLRLRHKYVDLIEHLTATQQILRDFRKSKKPDRLVTLRQNLIERKYEY